MTELAHFPILATLGPASLDGPTIKSMTEAGVSLFRINLSHTKIETLEGTIELIREHTDTPICLDSEGAQIRTARFDEGAIQLVAGKTIEMSFDNAAGRSDCLAFYPAGVARDFREGDLIDIDFHHAQIHVTEVSGDVAKGIVARSGKVGSNKAVSIDRAIPLPAITNKDIEAIDIGRNMGIKHFALSFANTPDGVAEFRNRIGEAATLIAKIESTEGLRNLEGISRLADAILIDRGDLSSQVAIESIPFVQRRIIAFVRAMGKPVFVATNLLESMVESISPNRAEVNDVVSSLDMGATGLVLAAETAIGEHPVAAVEMIARLIDRYSRWTPHTTLDEILEFF